MEWGYFQPQKKLKAAVNESGVFIGLPVSRGVVTGRARIILDPVNDNRLEAGDILITRTTDPGWTPLFKIAGGLILERGGLLSHGAIVSREFGMPAVVGIDDAVRVIPDCAMISVDGNTGEVIVLRSEA